MLLPKEDSFSREIRKQRSGTWFVQVHTQCSPLGLLPSSVISLLTTNSTNLWKPFPEVTRRKSLRDSAVAAVLAAAGLGAASSFVSVR